MRGLIWADKQAGGENAFSCTGSEGILSDYAERAEREDSGLQHRTAA